MILAVASHRSRRFRTLRFFVLRNSREHETVETAVVFVKKLVESPFVSRKQAFYEAFVVQVYGH